MVSIFGECADHGETSIGIFFGTPGAFQKHGVHFVCGNVTGTPAKSIVGSFAPATWPMECHASTASTFLPLEIQIPGVLSNYQKKPG